MKAINKANRKGLELWDGKMRVLEDFVKYRQPSFIFLIAYCTTSLSGYKEIHEEGFVPGGVSLIYGTHLTAGKRTVLHCWDPDSSLMEIVINIYEL